MIVNVIDREEGTYICNEGNQTCVLCEVLMAFY